jgi:hypothetical protein
MAESATSVGSLTFLGLFAMFSLRPLFTHPGSRARPVTARLTRWFQCLARSRHEAVGAARLVRHFQQTSYWLGGVNEMVAINPILIIVNAAG